MEAAAAAGAPQDVYRLQGRHRRSGDLLGGSWDCRGGDRYGGQGGRDDRAGIAGAR